MKGGHVPPFPHQTGEQTVKNILIIAMACHAINMAYCASLGDNSLKPWDEMPKEHRDGLQAGVKMHLDNPDATPEDAHNSWAAAKLAAGWVHGEVKDMEAKTHPCLLPYSELPPEQRSKDYIFRAAVHAIAAMPEPVAAPTEATQPGHQAVVFIGKADEYEDHIYGTRLKFKQGQVRNLPDAIAIQFLRHGDLFDKAEPVTKADEATATAIKDNLAEKQTLDQVQFEAQTLRDTINTLPTKASLLEFAKNQFQQELDPNPAKHKLEELRQTVLSYVDLYGPR